MRINAVSVANTQHRWNPEMADVDMMIPDSWLIPALSQNRLHIEHAMVPAAAVLTLPPIFPHISFEKGKP
jgi:hypothetical protein